jgi:hypothetical protein
MNINGYECEVDCISDGYARGPDGTCAFCAGDPCNEYPEQNPDAAMKKYAVENPRFETCPCCEGRPT